MATKLSYVIAEVICPELSTLFVAINTCLLEAPPIRSSVAMAELLVADVLWSLGWGVAGLLFLAWALRVLNRAWWRPRWLERALRAQGLNGTAYRFPYGDLKENARFSKEARAKPMPLAHNIIPRLLPFLNRAMDEYGKISFTWFGPVPQVTITDPELVREVLSNKFGHFGKPKQHPLGRFFARGLAVYEGEKWVKHRRILNPAFHAEKLKRMLPAFSACCSDLMDRWENMAGSEACYELDVWPELQSFTGDVISRTAFGSSYEEGRPIFQLQAEQAELIIQVVQNLYVPGYRFLPTPKNKRIKAIDREIRSILRGIIKKREQDIKTGKASNDDLLGLLMESNMKHLQEDGNKNAGMTTEDVIEECKLFYFAGQETTSVLLTWTMICLSMHPTWQIRAREEVLRVFGDDKPDFDGLSHLKIVTMILYEVLRLYPPAILLQRQTYKTMKLGDVVYPPGVLLLLHVIFVHHDPNLWGKDASEFNPERFAEGVSKASKEQVAFFPFGGGPRICIGQNFALLEAKMGLSMILQHFSFDLSPSYAHAPHTVLTLHPQHVICPELSILFVARKSCLLEAPPIRSSVAMAEFLAADVLWSLGRGVAGLLFLAWALRVLNWAWWRPRRLERALRAQGLNGSPYRFPYGDVKEILRLRKEARAKPMPLVHNIIPRLLPFFHRAMDKYGKRFLLLCKISFTWFGPVPQVTITDPELVREVLSNKFGIFGKPTQNPLSRFFSKGLFVYEGEKWVKHRRIMNPAFHAEKLKRMLPAFSACCSDLMNRWEKMAGSEACYELDVWPELQSFSGDVISRTAFGSSYEEGRQIFQLQSEQAELVIQVVQNLYVPGYRFLPTPKNKRIKAIDREIRSILRRIIKKREQDIKTGKASTGDLLGLLMESNMKHLQEDGNKNAGMTTEDVIEECKLFYFAGQETTSALLTWTMICLSMHPTWQVRAREEVLRVFGENKPDFDGLSHLKIVTMILYEVLRLYPPFILIRRQTYKTMKIGDVVYPPGVLLLLHAIFVHHDPNLWGKDASEFNPERFGEGVSKASKEQVAFFPFGGGPRICIGQNFSLLEAKMGLSMILQHFYFDLSPSYAHAPRTIFTLYPQRVEGALRSLSMKFNGSHHSKSALLESEAHSIDLMFLAADVLWSLGWGVAGLLFLAWALRVLNWAWWRPRRLERALRAQGLNGTPYGFPYGDVKETARLREEARAKPMPLAHNIIPRLLPFFHRAMDAYGKRFLLLLLCKISFTWFGPVPQVNIKDPELVREVLSNKFGHFGKPNQNPLARFFARGLAVYEGEKWVKHRRILNPAFHAEKLKRMLPAFSACCSDLMDRWENMAGSEACYELDIWPELQSFTGDVISRTAFGSSYEEGRPIFQLQAEQAELLIQVVQNLYVPGYRFLPTPKNKRIKAIDREIRSILRGIIKKREQDIKTGKASNDDLLGLLMESNMKHLQEDGNKNAGMTTEDVIEECKLFYFAGQETTSVLLTWTMICLSMHPTWQVRAREEVLRVFGDNKPDLDGLSHLKIVTMILYEVLRLYPPAILLQRQTYKTMKLGDVVYPPGVLLLLHVIFVHHDPNLWGKDASEFNPERFAEGVSRASNEQVAFFPFGGGPRICIGQNFALLEAKMGLSMILQHFSFDLSPSYAHAPHTVFTLHPQHVICPELSIVFVAIKSCLLEPPRVRLSVAMAEFLAADVLWSLGWGVAGLLFLAWALRVLNWAWWRPRRLERALRAQGLKGTAYRFPYGDLKENARFSKEARAKSMPLAHNIIPRLLPFYHRAMDEYGKRFLLLLCKISFTWSGPVPQVAITDPELVREVLSNKFGHFGKPNQNPLARFFARGLAVYEGEKWVKHRRILNPAFHAETLKRMLPAFSACCSDLMDRWENMAGSEACYELDVWPELQSFTGDVISRTAFGSSYEEGRPIFQLQAEQAELLIQVIQNLYVPGYRFLPTPKNKRIKAIDREIRSILRGIIKKREQDIKTGMASNDDLLGLLMESNMKHLQEDGNKNAGMTTEDVIEECKLFYFAGQETTSVLLTWTMICLSMHPTWQIRAREEVLRVFGENKPDFDGLSHLKIVTMILYEVLRLYPPFILLRRQTYKTMKLGDVVYPPGVLLLLHAIFVHHDPNLWGKDASEFNPERFGEGVSKASKEQVAFFPFGGGPRICIGQNFALLEAKMGLSMILQHFSFDLSPSYAHAPHTVFTLHPQHGAQIRLRKLLSTY
ncbi:unnamed protein product, partial [Musa hybrid cultivar]